MKNHSHFMVEAHPAQENELREYFSFFVPGYKFMPAYKSRHWDGKVKLYNSMTKQMNVGLYTHLRRFCADRFYQLEILEHETYGIPSFREDIDHPALVEFLSLLDAPFKPRDYQYKAISHGIEHRRSILLSPTGSGKSFIIYNLLRYCYEVTNEKILVVVPTTSLVEQMYKDFEDYGYDVEEFCHRIYSGKEKETDKRIIISTWQSIYKFGKEWFEQFGTVFGDEVHLFKAKSLTTMMDKCIDVARRPRRGLGGFASRARATIDSNAPTPRASRSTSARVRASIDDALVRAAGDRRANAPRGRRCLNHRAMAARARARARARTTSRGRHRRGGAGVSRRDAMRCDATRWDASSSSRARARDSRGENPEEEFTSRVARGRGRGVGASRRSNARGFVAARARRDSRHPRGVTLDASRDVRASGSARDETMRGRRDETHARFGD